MKNKTQKLPKIKVKIFFLLSDNNINNNNNDNKKKQKKTFPRLIKTQKSFFILIHRLKQNEKEKKINIEIKQLFVELMNNIEINHVDNMMEYAHVLQTQVLYLQLHNQFVS
jgi:hypothetical protein